MGTIKKIAVLSPDDPWVHRIGDILLELGFEAKVFDWSKIPKVEYIRNLETFSPDLCLSHNYYAFDVYRDGSGELAEFIHRKAWPTALWFLDSPTANSSVLSQSQFAVGPWPKNYLYFTWDQAHLDFFKQRNLPAHHLPGGVDARLEKWRPDVGSLARFEFPISFVGSPLLVGEMGTGQAEEILDRFLGTFLKELFEFVALINRQDPVVDPQHFKEYFQEILGSLKKFLERDVNTPETYQDNVRVLMQSLQARIPAPLHKILEMHLGRLSFFYSHFQLYRYLDHFQKHGLRLFGGESWKSMFPRVEYATPRLSEQDLWHLFRASAISFCLTKWQFVSAVHERPLLALACGGFPLTDERAEIREMFQTGELASYSSLQECDELIKFYLSRPETRRQMSEKGRSRVFKEHTLQIRLKRLIEICQNHFS